MITASHTPNESRNVWPHRWAVLLVCATFPLIWVGGLVTTYDAGMAVPDWPSTYGYNLFLYPWSTWIAGPWDLFIEHGHRLLGALVGMITIGLVVTAWRKDARPWFRQACGVALPLVIVQGLLGGARVVLNERMVAMVHGCVGPAFFAYAVFLAAASSRWWAQATRFEPPPALEQLAITTVAVAYVQLVLGACLRHIPDTAKPQVFATFVVFHLIMAVVVAGHALWLSLQLAMSRADGRLIRLPAFALVVLVVGQLVLGGGTWLLKYHWPFGTDQADWAAGLTLEAHGLLQSLVVTGHVATGSLIIAVSLLVAVRVARLNRANQLADPLAIPLQNHQTRVIQEESRSRLATTTHLALTSHGSGLHSGGMK